MAALMLVFAVLPAGAVGFAVGRVTGDIHHSRVDERSGKLPPGGQPWYRDNGQDRQQRQWPQFPARPNRPGAPTAQASPSAS